MSRKCRQFRILTYEITNHLTHFVYDVQQKIKMAVGRGRDKDAAFKAPGLSKGGGRPRLKGKLKTWTRPWGKGGPKVG